MLFGWRSDGLVVGVVHFRRRCAFILICGIAVMVLPDLLAGDRDWPHEPRIVGAFPFVAALAGLGIGAVLDWLSQWRDLKRLAVVLLCAALGVTVQTQVTEFFGAEQNLGRMHWGGNTQLRRVDSGVAELIVNDGQSYILPLSNYADSVIKYLTSKRALQVRSAVDADGALLPVLRQGAVRLVLPLEDDEQPWRGNPAQWVLFEGATAYILPPRMDLTALFPVLDDSSLIFGKGIDDNVRLGHVGRIDAQQLLQRLAPAALLRQSACFQNGICLKAVSYSRALLAPGTPLLFYHRHQFLVFLKIVEAALLLFHTGQRAVCLGSAREDHVSVCAAVGFHRHSAFKVLSRVLALGVPKRHGRSEH